MTSKQKQQQQHILLDRMVTRLIRDNPTTSTARELAAKSAEFMKEARAFNDAMLDASHRGIFKPSK